MDISENRGPESEPEVTEAQTLEQTDKKCPACGGTMEFDPKTGALLCPYCGNIVEIEEEDGSPARAEELSFDEAEHTGNCDWGSEKRVVVCKSCGAETVYDASTVAGECPYCGSNQVMEAGADGILAPGGVCPFKVTPEDAGGRFLRWLKKKLFCPSSAKKEARAGKMRGVYLPYWTFDADTDSTYTARYGIERVVRRGKETRVVVDWHRTSGTYHEFVNDQLVSGTEKHDGSMLSGIEPFDTENNVAYKPEYIAGFASERYSVGLKAAWEKAKSFIKSRLLSHITAKIKKEHHADRVDSVNVKTAYRNITYKYLMLPVWMSSFVYKGKVYQFMVNGQTGKVSGKAPVSPLRVAIAVFIGIVIVGLIAVALLYGGGEVYYY